MSDNRGPAVEVARVIPKANEPQVWTCKIGGFIGYDLPMGADSPLRVAVRDAYHKLTGVWPDFEFTGWSGELTATEFEVAYPNRPSSPPDEPPRIYRSVENLQHMAANAYQMLGEIRASDSADREPVYERLFNLLDAMQDPPATRPPDEPSVTCYYCYQPEANHCVGRCPDGGGYWKAASRSPAPPTVTDEDVERARQVVMRQGGMLLTDAEIRAALEDYASRHQPSDYKLAATLWYTRSDLEAVAREAAEVCIAENLKGTNAAMVQAKRVVTRYLAEREK